MQNCWREFVGVYKTEVLNAFVEVENQLHETRHYRVSVARQAERELHLRRDAKSAGADTHQINNRYSAIVIWRSGHDHTHVTVNGEEAGSKRRYLAIDEKHHCRPNVKSAKYHIDCCSDV